MSEISFKVARNSLQISGQAWGATDAAVRVLAWPTCGDNSASFCALGPQLARSGCHVIALDPPGCGRSQHLPTYAFYNNFDECMIIIQIADQLKWKDFYLLGHGYGGTMCLLVAAAFPERIRGVIVFQSFLDDVGTSLWARVDHTPAVDKEKKLEDSWKAKNLPVYPSFESVVEECVRETYRQQDESLVREICKRDFSVIKDEKTGRDVWRQHTDDTSRSQITHFPEQTLQTFYKAIRCPVLWLNPRGITDGSQWVLIVKQIPNWKNIHKEYIELVDKRASCIRLLDKVELELPSRHVKLYTDGYPHYHQGVIFSETILLWFQKNLRSYIHDPTPLPPLPELFNVYRKTLPTLVQKLSKYQSEDWKQAHSVLQIPEEMQPTELVLDIFGLKVAARLWGDRASEKKILAWPGWLDNAGSYDAIAPYFVKKGYCVLAVDPPGCGLSDHYPLSVRYATYNEAVSLLHVTRAVGWKDDIILLLHSRAGTIGLLAAAADSKRFKGLIILDSALGLSEPVDDTVQLMTRCADYDKKASQKKLKTFASLEDAIISSYNNPEFPKSWITARNIARRHLKKIVLNDDNKKEVWQFTHDRRTYDEKQPYYNTHEYLCQVMANIKAPILVLFSKLRWRKEDSPEDKKQVKQSEENERMALKISVDKLLGQVDPALAQWKKDWQNRQETEMVEKMTLCQQGVELIPINAGHHLHSDNPQACWEVIEPWLQSKFAKPTDQLRSRL